MMKIMSDNLRKKDLFRLKNEIDKLSNQEFDSLISLLSNQDELNKFLSQEYYWLPEPIENWINNKYYCGDLYDKLYDKLKKDLIDIFSGSYYEIILTGAIGWGKSTLARVMLIRLLYELLCMKNPQKFFGIESGSYIYFAVISVTEKLAIPVLLEQLYYELKTIPFFLDNFKFKVVNNEIRFYDKNVKIIPSGVGNSGVLGLNILGAIIDEANFVKESRNFYLNNSSSRIKIVYDAIVRRMKSRFIFNNKYFGKMILVSSNDEEDSFVDRHIADVISDDEVYIKSHSVWDVKPQGTFSDEKFYVLYSSNNKNFIPKIISKNDISKLENVKEGFNVIEIPIDFKKDFEDDIYGSLRDLAGVSISSTSKFINKIDCIYSAIDNRRRHPSDTMVFQYSINTSYKDILNSIRWDSLFVLNNPIVSPDKIRYAHIDLGITSDSTGITIAHIPHYVMSRKGNTTIYNPYIFIDFMYKITPVRGAQIQISHIVELFNEFRKRGFRFGRITLDSFQGFALSQMLASNGFKVDYLSVDRETFAYELLKSAFLDNRISMYDYPPVIEELEKLIIRRKTSNKYMVDHPKTGSKDVADSLSGVIYSLTINYKEPVIMLDNQKNLMTGDITIGNETIDYETAVLLGIIKPDKNDDFNSKNVVIDKESDKISVGELYDKLPFLKG